MASSDFETRRAQLQQARGTFDQRDQALFLAREKLKQLQARQGELARIFDPDNPRHRGEQRRLKALQAETEKQIAGLTEEWDRARQVLDRHLEAFLPLTDPRELVGQMNDSFPFLLLPLRLETRFKQVQTPNGGQPQLWVRVYPDDVAVDTFEEALSETEVSNAQTYWGETWRAGSDESLRRAAWRNLVASHGSGRAFWIVEHYRPLNEADQPAGGAGTLILVIRTESPLDAAQQAAAATFWTALWRAGSDANAVAAAQTALTAAVGADAAQTIMDDYRPFNLDDAPPADRTREDAAVVVAAVIFEPADETRAKRRAWSKPPRVTILPDRLVLIGISDGAEVINQLGSAIPSPLIVGPDPQAPETNQIRQVGDDITVSAEMQWMVDFDEAVRQGMGFRVNLTPQQFERGLDQLLVLGVRLSSDEHDGQTRFEDLLRNHHRSRTGLSLIPQGTPTNNTDRQGSGYASTDDADRSYDILASGEPLFTLNEDWFDRADGQWLAEWLGIDPALLQTVDQAGRSDVRDAQAMNLALWPATIGYWMDTMLSSVFSDQAVETTRQFFSRFVSGRGMVPALRIGKQPYGILPTSAYSQMRWPLRSPGTTTHVPAAGSSPFLNKLHEILMRAYGVWGTLHGRAGFIGKRGDPHQILLDILGLHPTSEEHYLRYAESLEQVINSLNFYGLPGLIEQMLTTVQLLNQGTQILADHGYDVNTRGRPDLLDKYFFQAPQMLNGPLVDDQPLSEAAPIRAYTTDGRNYITWLADAARVSLETVRQQQGFIDNTPPTALLYLMLRHAVQLGYYDTSVQLYLRANVLSDEERIAARVEPNFIHVREQAASSESRWKLLYQPKPEVTGTQTGLLVADYIPTVIDTVDEAARLREQLAALDRLHDLATARLERVFVEHLDTASYRLDAWLQGLVYYQLSQMRFNRLDEGQTARRGLYLGAYGWLENVRPENKGLAPLRWTDPDLRAIFERPGESPVLRDPTNAGYIHAPSPNHAVTAAVLRNGYLSNSSPDQPGQLAVNLSSERVRRAMAIIEGIHGGQSLGALLGYQFERGLHDRHNQAEVDQFIYKLRKAFPLRADRIAETATDETVSIESIEARNVLDGLSLVEHILTTGEDQYPFGRSDLPAATSAQAAAINAEAQRLLDTHDAVADLGIAEGVHQVVQGNYDRAAASLDAFSQGDLPPIPDVVQTPRSGVGLTHRVGLHLRPGLPPTATPHVGLAVTPRASAEPALNDWLSGLLPAPDQIGVVVSFADGTGAAGDVTLTQADLGLQAMDLLYLLRPEDTPAMTALDDRIIRHVLSGLRSDATITIRYTQRPASLVSLFEAGALINHLRPLLLGARPLQSTDLSLPNETDKTALPLPVYHLDRIEQVRDGLAAPLAALQTLDAELAALLADTTANHDDLVDHIDDRLERFVAALAPLSLYNLPHTGYGFALAWKRSRYATLLTKAESLIDRWQDRLDQFDDLLDDYDNLPGPTPAEERFARLKALEALVAIVLTDPLPADPADYRTTVVGRRGDFASKRNAFEAILGTTASDLAALLDDIRSESADLDQFDTVRLNLEDDENEIILFSQDLQTQTSNLVKDLQQRITTVNDDLAAYTAAADAATRTTTFTHAAQTLLGEDFRVIPEFSLLPAQADELQKAHAAESQLLDDLHTRQQVDFPVDDWLYGIARVRDPLRRWEAAAVLAETLTGDDLDLHPLQLPYQDGDSWLALPYPDSYTVSNDKLLYTAHYAVPFDKTAAQCGLLLDEWTEVIPTDQETTSIAFHYDRPNAEPPQVMLLVAPPQIRGRWVWADLVSTLRETLELARRRAVEPDFIDSTDYARFLPATISAVTFHPITIALNLALNNQVFAQINPNS